MPMDPESKDEDISSGGDGGEDTESRRARMLIYLVAAGFLLVGAMDVFAYWMRCERHHEDISIAHCLVLSIPFVIGLVILVMSSALARAIGDYLDE